MLKETSALRRPYFPFCTICLGMYTHMFFCPLWSWAAALSILETLHSIFLAWLPIAWQALSSGHPTALQKAASGVSRFKTQNQKIGCSLSRSGINSTQEALPFTTWLRGERGIQRLLRGIIWVGWVSHSEKKGAEISQGRRPPCEDPGSSGLDVTQLAKFKATPHSWKSSTYVGRPGSIADPS